MEWIQTAATIWVIAFMMFKMNPLNNPNNPTSKMCAFHHDNIRGRMEMEEILEEEKFTDERFKTDVIILWPDVYPYIMATSVTVTAWIVYKALEGLVSAMQ